LFGDLGATEFIMASDNPREMKQIGRRIRGYVDSEWKSHSHEIVMQCVRRKVYDHQAVQDYLLSTGAKIIGEGTPDRHFGVGLHIRDSRVLNYNEWQGNNIMGKALMEVRSEIKLLQGVLNEEPSCSSDVANPMISSTPGNFPRNTDDEQMVVSPILDLPKL
jgi:ribA/ribD-fused uncharacterized protein